LRCLFTSGSSLSVVVDAQRTQIVGRQALLFHRDACEAFIDHLFRVEGGRVSGIEQGIQFDEIKSNDILLSTQPTDQWKDLAWCKSCRNGCTCPWRVRRIHHVDIKRDE